MLYPPIRFRFRTGVSPLSLRAPAAATLPAPHGRLLTCPEPVFTHTPPLASLLNAPLLAAQALYTEQLHNLICDGQASMVVKLRTRAYWAATRLKSAYLAASLVLLQRHSWQQ